MDINADGNTDLLVAGYGGFADIYYGKADGTFAEAKPLLNEDGVKVNLGSYWCYDQNIWTTFAREKIKKGGISHAEIALQEKIEQQSTHFTLLTVVDWDNDGDYDLILNSQPKVAKKDSDQKPKVCLNIGDKKNPKFSRKVFEIKEISRVHYAEAIGDWDGDGLFDIISGSKGYHVQFYKNIGKLGKPKFAEPVILFKNEDFINGAHGGEVWIMQPSICDYNNDGKLDLLIGTNTNNNIPAKLTKEQKAERTELEKVLKETIDGITKYNNAYYKKHGQPKTNEAYKKMTETLNKNADFKALVEKQKEVYTKLWPLKDKMEGGGYVWVSLRK